jgi:hypothetical protein
MQAFTLATICCVTLCEFTVQRLNLPTIFRFIPELLSGVVLLYVVIAGTVDRFRLVAPKYWLVCGALAFEILCGILNNDPGPGPLISGLRLDFKAAPLFFLGAVLPMTEKRLKQQLMLVLGLALFQVPLAVYQRWVVLSTERWTGDEVRGTIMDSGVLSMFLICVALVVAGLLLKRRISLVRFAVLFLLLLFPTMINETKVTVILVPLGLLVTLIAGSEPGKRLRYAGMALSLLVVFGAIFVPIYDKMEAYNPTGYNIVEFFSNEKTLNNYLISNGRGHSEGVGTTHFVHRGDAIIVPFQYLAKDPVLLAFGLGLGNVSPSTSGKNFEGRYFDVFASFLKLSFTFFLLEFGVFGVLLIGLLNWMIFSDSLVVSRRDDTIAGALATGWLGVVAIFMVALFYDPFHYFASVTYLYWYFSGVVCARRMALAYGTAPLPGRALHPQSAGAG